MQSVTKIPSLIGKKKTITRRKTMGKISLDTEIEAAYHIMSQIDDTQGNGSITMINFFIYSVHDDKDK